VVVAGSYAYLACSFGFQGLIVANISDPAHPSLAGSYPTTDGASHVTIAGHYAYLSESNTGVRILDISDPKALVSVGFYNLPASGYPYANGVAISGNYAFLAAGNVGLHILDVTHPGTPSKAGDAQTDMGFVEDVKVVGKYAYVAGYQGVFIFDITNPTHPVKAGSYRTSGRALDLEVMKDLIYVADGRGGLAILQVKEQQKVYLPLAIR
jgi:hypothetical protein